jgi:hypothetical protein
MSRALIPAEPMAQPSACAPRLAAHRPGARFLAHLIAMAAQAPQTRSRRRAGPGEATTAYAALERPPAATGRALSRWL